MAKVTVIGSKANTPAAKPNGKTPPAKQPPAKTPPAKQATNKPATKPAPVVKGKGALAALTGMFQPMMLDTVPQDLPRGGGAGTFVGFAHSQNSMYDSLVKAGIVEGDPFVSIDGQLIKLDPFEFLLIDAFACRATFDDKYNLTGATADMTDRDYDEYYLTHLAVFLPEPVEVGGVQLDVIPARAEFIRAMGRVAADAIDAVRAAKDPTFAALSNDHKLAAQCPLVAARVKHVAFITMPTSRSSGYKYLKGNVQSGPTGMGDLVKFAEAAQTEAYQTKKAEIEAEIAKRRDAIQQIIG